MADELKLKISLDTGDVKDGFSSVENQAKKTSKNIGDAFSGKGKGIESLTEALESTKGGLSGVAEFALRSVGPVGGLGIAIGAASFALGKFALAGEKVNAINTQFENLARQSGLAVDQFKESIIESTKGLIDDEDALQIATKGLIALGDEAKQLPQILDAARGVSRALGKDFKETFADLSTFVETGNARVLRQFGIILDLNKAYDNAAKSIGLVASQLTEQQKQTIRSNLLLEEVPKRFNAATESVTPLADAFDRLRVKASNALESIQSSLAKTFTKAFIDDEDLGNIGLSRLTEQLQENQKQIDSFNKQISDIKTDALASRSVQATARVRELQQAIKDLVNENERIAVQASGLSDAQLFKDLDASPRSAGAPITRNAEQDKLLADQRRKQFADLQSFIITQDKIVLDSESKRIEQITNLSNKESALRSIASQQFILLEQQKNLALTQVDEQFSASKGFTLEQREQARLAIIQNFYNQEQLLAQQNADALRVIEENKNLNLLTSQQAFYDGFGLATKEFSANAINNFREVGKQAFNTLGRGVGQAFAAFGQALASGEDAGKAFLQSLIGIFADIAIQLGTSYILQGIAASANPFTPGIGGPLIAAGAALATFGGLLKGLSGGKSTAQQQESGGGGIASSPSSTTELNPEQNLTRTEPQTAVQLIVQGDIFDSDSTASRLTDLLNDAFDKKGVVIQRGAFA